MDDAQQASDLVEHLWRKLCEHNGSLDGEWLLIDKTEFFRVALSEQPVMSDPQQASDLVERVEETLADIEQRALGISSTTAGAASTDGDPSGALEWCCHNADMIREQVVELRAAIAALTSAPSAVEAERDAIEACAAKMDSINMPTCARIIREMKHDQ